MKIAAYQAPLLSSGSLQVVDLIAQRVRECEETGVSVLCCPEGILGGLADYSDNPLDLAIEREALALILKPLTTASVASIIGFTEAAPDGKLYNAAAVFQRGAVTGVYRKVHPAIRRSVYAPGSEIPVFRAGALTFGIMICNDSNFPEVARQIAGQGATALFIPTNNGLPIGRDPVNTREVTQVDKGLAMTNRLWVIRADVCGTNGILASYGSSEIVDAAGNVVTQARYAGPEMLVAEIRS